MKVFFIDLDGVMCTSSCYGRGKDNKWECAEYVITTYAFDGDYFDCRATPTQVVNMACNKWQAPIYKLEQ